jgi:SAM-dependent methyltransferase
MIGDLSERRDRPTGTAARRHAMFTLDQVVPWGRSFAEYQQLFALTPADLERRILGCGDGPAAFNAEATRRGGRVVSCDPLYAFSRTDIETRIAATCDTVLEQTRRHADQFVWGHGIASIDELGEVRMRAMRVFLADYDAGREAGRYVDASLPTLPFTDGSFDLALCSHLLFLYSAQFDEAFHRASVREMCRVAPEVRIFPLLALDGSRSPFVDACVAEARAAGADAEMVRVPYEFQRGGNEMLRLRRGAAAA